MLVFGKISVTTGIVKYDTPRPIQHKKLPSDRKQIFPIEPLINAGKALVNPDSEHTSSHHHHHHHHHGDCRRATSLLAASRGAGFHATAAPFLGNSGGDPRRLLYPG